MEEVLGGGIAGDSDSKKGEKSESVDNSGHDLWAALLSLELSALVYKEVYGGFDDFVSRRFDFCVDLSPVVSGVVDYQGFYRGS